MNFELTTYSDFDYAESPVKTLNFEPIPPTETANSIKTLNFELITKSDFDYAQSPVKTLNMGNFEPIPPTANYNYPLNNNLEL